ncbi:hypothetical protein ABIQ69_01880 [Agromyces sp. G08B096]|uniref:MFS transporter n=1 Tax=Agromyces sp. G08B096 TaxID=3156399 RepID=A0AAU7W7Q9_9MICO
MSETPDEARRRDDDVEDALVPADEASVPADPAEASAPVVVPMVVTSDVTDEAVTVRRAPRYGRFMVLGAALGVVLALILTFAFPESDEFDRGQVFGFLLLGLGAIGVAFGALVALLFDRVLAGRAGTAIAEHESSHRAD